MKRLNNNNNKKKKGSKFTKKKKDLWCFIYIAPVKARFSA